MRESALRAVATWVEESGLDWESRGDTFIITLPGEHKLKTTCAVSVGEHALSINAFVARHVDENHALVYDWLLKRNRRLFAVAYALDHLGDVYLVGKLPLAGITVDEVDRLMGTVAAEADGSFNTILELGFRSAIVKEWRWRLARDEPTHNLAAFEHLRPEE